MIVLNSFLINALTSIVSYEKKNMEAQKEIRYILIRQTKNIRNHICSKNTPANEKKIKYLIKTKRQKQTSD